MFSQAYLPRQHTRCPPNTHPRVEPRARHFLLRGSPASLAPPPPKKGPRPTRLPQTTKAYPGPPRRVGRPPVAFSNSTINRSCPHYRHNRSPGGKVCRREGKHRHSAAPSPRRPFPRPTRPLHARAEGRITSPQIAPEGVRPAQGAGAGRGRHLPSEELLSRGEC